MDTLAFTPDAPAASTPVRVTGPARKHKKIIGNLDKLLNEKPAVAALATAPEVPSYSEISNNSGHLPVDTGILLLALGHPYYGELAANLAMSLKHSGCPKIHLVYHGDALKRLTEKKRGFFDSMSLCPDEAIMKKGKVAYFKAKTWMYELSPFTNTLFLDADMLWFAYRSVNELIGKLQDVDWTIQNRERYDLSDPASEKIKYMWGKIADLRKHFSKGYLYSLHSELVWFRKTASNKEYFDYVRQIYDEPIIPATEFAGDIADELAFAIACLLCDKHPHTTPFHPIYWLKLDSRQGTEIGKLKENFYAYSVGGSAASALEINKYNMMVRGFAFRAGVQNPFRLKSKRQWLAVRKTM